MLGGSGHQWRAGQRHISSAAPHQHVMQRAPSTLHLATPRWFAVAGNLGALCSGRCRLVLMLCCGVGEESTPPTPTAHCAGAPSQQCSAERYSIPAGAILNHRCTPSANMYIHLLLERTLQFDAAAAADQSSHAGARHGRARVEWKEKQPRSRCCRLYPL